MKTTLTSILLLSGLASFSSAYEDKLLSTPWEHIRAADLVDVQPPFATKHGDPANYKYADIPFPNDSRWAAAPHKDDELHFDVKSRIPKDSGYKKLDFTYFRSYVHVPVGTMVEKFTVTINQVDDGARMLLFNDNHVGGIYRESEDAKLLGDNVTADFTKDAIAGWNMVLIVQFDDFPSFNKLTGGVHISVNGTRPDPNANMEELEITPDDIAFAPEKFIAETYGVDGKGRGPDAVRYFIGLAGDGLGIVTANEHEAKANQKNVMTLLREDLGDGLVALKIDGQGKYLPDFSSSVSEINKYRVVPPMYHQRDLSSDENESYNFISLQSVSDPGAYLRHGNYKVFNGKPTAGEQEAGSKSERVFQQDSTWHFHIME